MFTKRSLFLKKHSRRVLIFKHALPVFAFLCLAVIVIWPSIKAEKDKLEMSIQKTDIKSPSMDMENVRFFSNDEKNRTIVVTAESVKEIEKDTKLARMEKPLAVYTLADGDIVTAKTPYGLVHQEEQYFLFEQKINATSKSGYTAQASMVKATYDGVVDSNKTVTIKGPAGSLKAEGLHMERKGNFATFTGHTDSTIINKKETIQIKTEDGLTINRSDRTITGKKNVSIKQGENTLTADTVVLYYNETKENRIQKIIATGHVVIQNAKNKIMGDTGTYNPLTEDMFMKGNVRLYQGSSYVKADKATLNMKTGESKLENQQTKGRIKGTLNPNDLKK